MEDINFMALFWAGLVIGALAIAGVWAILAAVGVC